MKMDKMDLFSGFVTASKHLLKLDFFRMERLWSLKKIRQL